jgi:hypothetical protein
MSISTCDAHGNGHPKIGPRELKRGGRNHGCRAGDGCCAFSGAEPVNHVMQMILTELPHAGKEARGT